MQMAVRQSIRFQSQVSLIRRTAQVVSRRQYLSTSKDLVDKLPLAGVRILDLTRVLAGPYCTQVLADLGADVIKIEHPQRGDDTRAWGPPYATYNAGTKDGPGESAYFLAVNRNKRSLGLSFQDPEGVRILHEIASKCDVLVENFIPGTLAKYSMDYLSLKALNPGLIYTSITGYGQTGPYRERAGYDVMVEAEMGLMHITGERHGPPVKVGVAVTDLTTEAGQHIDVALSDCQVATLANIASSVLISGKKDSGRWETAHPSIVPYRGFQTSDGDIMIGGGNDRQFNILCDRLGIPEWKTNKLYHTNSARVQNRSKLEPMIEKVLKTKTTKEWLHIFHNSGMAYAAINDVHTTLNHEHVLARDMVVEVEHEVCGPLKFVNTPVKFSESEPSVRSAPPTLGQHTVEILQELVGMDIASIKSLQETGVIA